ncbi:MAG: hypothetical protein DRO98_06850 [Archaeoglobales archaeon]|nr:MAG: hypothetical protein DRO98_06850 [Archaeoglobales archaeon]
MITRNIMGLFDKVMDFIRKQMVTAEKDNVLVTAINYIVQDFGWTPKKIKFGADEHEMEYVKPDSPLKELEIEAKRVGSKLYLEFEGELKRGGFLHELLDEFFDIELGKEVKYHLVLNLHEFVTDDLKLRNEDKLREIIADYIDKIEEKARG